MPFMDLGLVLLLVVVSLVLGAVGAWAVTRKFRSAGKDFEKRIVTQTIAEQIRAVGKLVGLEVCAKEIATATSGWPWLPPILLSQARLAMIFQFEKQYAIDLGRIRPADVTEVAAGKYRISLPPIEGTLRLTDVFPYDIQSGRIMGLLDIIPMHADRQKDLMKRAQAQAAEWFEKSDARYLAEARASIERHLRTLLSMFNADVEIAWSDEGQIKHDATPTPGVIARPAQPATA